MFSFVMFKGNSTIDGAHPLNATVCIGSSDLCELGMEGAQSLILIFGSFFCGDLVIKNMGMILSFRTGTIQTLIRLKQSDQDLHTLP